LRDAHPWGRANNATGVIRRYTEARRRITASGYAPYAMSQPWGGANNATGVIRRYTDARRRITASGYASYAMGQFHPASA
ncbi:TPA: hypothetical protein ACJERX_005876, partial [Pseudomonas aeruginosa]